MLLLVDINLLNMLLKFMRKKSTQVRLSLKSYLLQCYLITLPIMLLNFTSTAQSTVTISRETFPNQYNTALATPVNATFAGSIGNWTAFSTTNKSTIGCFPAAYSPVTNAIKIVNWSTTGAAASDCYATSPVVNLSNPGCTQKYDIVFSLYTYNCVSGDNNAYLALDFSADGGTTWSTQWQMTSGQMYSNYGANGLTDIWLAIPTGSPFFTANFKYRFRGHMNAGNANNFYVFVDDIRILNWPCNTNVNLGNLVWNDVNQNGIKDAAESGISGITVQLSQDNDLDGINDAGFPQITTTTNASGNYNFTNIIPGNYLVALINVPTNYRLVAINAGDPDENVDNNNNGWYQSPSYTYIDGGWITVFPGQEPTNDGDGNNGNLTYDFGLYSVSSCNGRVTNLYFNELNGGADLPITNGFTFTVAQLGSLYNLEAGTSGTIGSVKYTITGPTPTSNIENTTPYNSPGTGSGAWTGAVGTYNVNLKTYSGADGTGTLCHDTTITFILTNTIFDCNCAATNVVLNPGFESGTTNWSWSGGTLAQGTGGVACGTYSGDLNNTVATSKAWQTIGTDLFAGTLVNVSVYAGTHDNTFNNWVAVEFLDAANVVLGTSVYVQVDKILANAPAGPQLYTFSATVPAGAKYTRVAFGGTGSYTKTDRWCATLTPPTGSIGDRVWLDADGDGIQDASETGGITGVTVQLRNSANTVIATTTTNATGNYLFSNLPAGNYTVVFPVSISGAVVTPQNVGANDDIDSDASQATGITPTITLAAGQNITNVDAGYCPTTLQLGNRVWNDVNNNGIDNTEAGIAGLTVNLYKDDNNDNVADGASIATTTTNATGNYNFSNLAPGNYIVGVTPPAGYVSSSINGGDPDNNTDLDDNGQVTAGAEIRGLAITLTGGAEPNGDVNNTYDFGFYQLVGSIGDRVWLDANGDGIQDASETGGITGVTVQLRNAANTVIATTTTNATGNYLFSNLPAGNYTVVFPISISGAVVTPQNVGANDDIDSDASQATGITPTIALAAGQNITNVDAGYCPTTLQLGNRVFNDINNNGIDNTEAGISGLTVNLYKDDNNDNVADGASIATTTTNATGNYLFSNLAPGNYIVGVTPPAGYVSSSINGGDPDNNTDLDNNGQVIATTEIRGLAITLTGGAEPNGDVNNTYDFGFFLPLGSIGDRVWNDVDGDGVQDANEVGIAGITVVLLNAAGQPIATTTTDAFGNYKFSGLPAGDYSVRITPPANYSLSAKGLGGDGNLDSDFDPITYTTSTVTLVAGQNRTDVDAGLKFTQPQTSSVGDRVWLDTDGDGVQDAGEPGVSNVLVTLYNSVGAPVRSTYTDVNGNYLFTDVTPGTYSVGVSLPPAFVFSPNTGAITGATNSDIVPATGRTTTFTVNAGDQITYVDAGLKTQGSTNGSVGDYVWNDINKNGVQDAGEPGIGGVTVRLVNATTNTIIATTTTDVTGKYIFNDVPIGDYKVDFVTPGGYTTTTKLNSNVAVSGTDSDVDPATSRTATFTLTAGQRITTVDAGYWLTTPPGTAKLGDRVWLDANQNGVQDAGETNVQGVTVTLYDASNTAIKLAVTDANGNYLFTDLAAGNYTVGFSNIPAGFTFTTQGAGTGATGSDANVVTGRTATIALAAGQTNLDIDAGIRSVMAGTASIGNRVWTDLNNNGLQDAGEPGVAGVTVELLDAAGNPIDKDPNTAGVQPTTTITNALGEYLFTGLPAGDYRVRFSTLPAGYNAAPKGAGTNRDIDSDGNTISSGTSTTDIVSVAAGEERLDIDFGLFNPTAPLGQLGDRVWFDSNNNGVQDAGEQGVPGVTVSLLNAANAVIATTVTDADGNYRFVNLANATYSVKFSNLPAGFVFSPKDLGGNDNTDSDADPVTGQTGTYTITAGNTNLTVDAGIYSTRAALGDYVWFDADNDGTQDATEKGIAGITVTLYDASNVAITSAITDQNGRYFFSNLNPGTYTVGFGTIPTQLVFTIKDAVVAGDLADSDVDPATGKTGPVTLTAGQVNLTVDAGLKPFIPATVGDFVWYDLNRDGIQDAAEPGVPGVIVTLYNAANQPIGSAITDGNGYYLISNVPAGTGYYIVFSNKPDAAAPWTLQNVGGAAANNNSKADATGQTAPFNVTEGQKITNMDAGLYRLINISGNVWHDANGLTDLQINKTSNQAIPNTLYIYLVDANTNQIVQLESPLGDGTFRFTDVEMNKSYVIVLSSVLAFPGQSSPIPFLPSGWQRVGENLGTGPLSGSDGIPDGMLFLDTETSDVIDANFGIRLRSGEVIIG
jgi:protocatechuate 3,4-dioxygenase beta subunit